MGIVAEILLVAIFLRFACDGSGTPKNLSEVQYHASSIFKFTLLIQSELDDHCFGYTEDFWILAVI